MTLPADLLIRVREPAAGSTTYPVEAELGDGSRFGDGQLVLDREALLASEAAADPATYGRLLFETLFSGSIRDAYDRVLPAPDTEGLIRVRLAIDGAGGEVEALRWERLYRERRGTWVPLAAAGDSPFSRYRSLPFPEPLPVATLPVRILLAVANPTGLPSRLAPIDVEREIRTFHDALGEAAATDDVEVTVLAGRTGLSTPFRRELERDGYVLADGPTTLAEVVRRMSGSHVVHVVGHGGFRQGDAGTAPQSALYLEAGDGAWAPATADQLVAALAAAEDPPALIYLSACETGRNPADPTHPFLALAPRLVGAGAAAVVAMQDAVPVTAARTLTQTFYAHLLSDGIVDLALNEARAVLAASGGLDWTIPVLVTRLHQGRLLVRHDLAQRVVSGDVAVTPGAAHGALADRVDDVPPARRRPQPVLLLPRDFAALLGRDAEVVAAARDLSRGGLIEFYGAPGIGKSVILRHLSNRVASATPDGVVYVPRSSEPVHDVLQFLFDALYEADASLRPTDADLERLLAACGPVIVLDDADLPREALEQLIALVPQGRLVVATTERNLWGEGRATALTGLPTDAALALFERGLGRRLKPDEQPRARALCASFEGHPLHILQAAARAADGAWPEAGAASRPDIRALPAVEQSILAVVVAAGTALHVDRIAAVVQADGVEEAAAHLEDMGLLRSASPRYALAEPLTPEEERTLEVAAWRSRLLAHLVTWVEQNRNSPAVLVRDLDAIVAAADGPAATAEPASALRLARGSEGALILAKRFDRWAAVLGTEERLASSATDQAALGWVRHQQGTRALALRDEAGARAALRQALAIRESVNDSEGAAVTRHNLELLGPVPPTRTDTGESSAPRRSSRARLRGPLGLLVVAAAIVGLGVLVWLLNPRRTVPPVLPAMAFDQSSIDFGTVEIGQRSEKMLTVTNASDVDLVITGLALDPPLEDLSLDGRCIGLVPARGTCVVTISFVPSADGDRGSTLVIDDNTLEAHHTLPVLAQGAIPPGEPGITIDPVALDFGAVLVGAPVSGRITVTSTGTADAEIREVRPPPGEQFAFGSSDCVGRVLPPGSSCFIDVIFTPHGRFPFTDELLIVDSTSPDPHSVSLLGSGLIGLADLVTRIDVSGDGDWVDQEDGTVALPVSVSVRNEGDVEAAPAFFLGGQARVAEREAELFLVTLAIDEVDGVVQAEAQRPAITTPLPPGGEVRFTGRLIFDSFLRGSHALVGVMADSCAGEKFVDRQAAEQCRVPEILETNNLSNELEVDIPFAPPTAPPTIKLRPDFKVRPIFQPTPTFPPIGRLNAASYPLYAFWPLPGLIE